MDLGEQVGKPGALSGEQIDLKPGISHEDRTANHQRDEGGDKDNRENQRHGLSAHKICQVNIIKELS